MAIMDIVGPGKPHLLNAVPTRPRRASSEPTASTSTTYRSSARPVCPSRSSSSINSVIEATQRAQEAQNKVAQSTAEAQQRVAEANGIAQSVLIKAKAQADANRILKRVADPDAHSSTKACSDGTGSCH